MTPNKFHSNLQGFGHGLSNVPPGQQQAQNLPKTNQSHGTGLPQEPSQAQHFPQPPQPQYYPQPPYPLPLPQPQQTDQAQAQSQQLHPSYPQPPQALVNALHGLHGFGLNQLTATAAPPAPTQQPDVFGAGLPSFEAQYQKPPQGQPPSQLHAGQGGLLGQSFPGSLDMFADMSAASPAAATSVMVNAPLFGQMANPLQYKGPPSSSVAPWQTPLPYEHLHGHPHGHPHGQPATNQSPLKTVAKPEAKSAAALVEPSGSLANPASSLIDDWGSDYTPDSDDALDHGNFLAHLHSPGSSSDVSSAFSSAFPEISGPNSFGAIMKLLKRARKLRSAQSPQLRFIPIPLDQALKRPVPSISSPIPAFPADVTNALSSGELGLSLQDMSIVRLSEILFSLHCCDKRVFPNASVVQGWLHEMLQQRVIGPIFECPKCAKHEKKTRCIACGRQKYLSTTQQAPGATGCVIVDCCVRGKLMLFMALLWGPPWVAPGAEHDDGTNEDWERQQLDHIPDEDWADMLKLIKSEMALLDCQHASLQEEKVKPTLVPEALQAVHASMGHFALEQRWLEAAMSNLKALERCVREKRAFPAEDLLSGAYASHIPGFSTAHPVKPKILFPTTSVPPQQDGKPNVDPVMPAGVSPKTLNNPFGAPSVYTGIPKGLASPSAVTGKSQPPSKLPAPDGQHVPWSMKKLMKKLGKKPTLTPSNLATAKGTGYGGSRRASRGDSLSRKTAKERTRRDELLSAYLDALHRLLPTMRNGLEFGVSLPELTHTMLLRSPIWDLAEELLQCDSVVEVSSRADVYNGLINFIATLGPSLNPRDLVFSPRISYTHKAASLRELSVARDLNALRHAHDFSILRSGIAESMLKMSPMLERFSEQAKKHKFQKNDPFATFCANFLTFLSHNGPLIQEMKQSKRGSRKQQKHLLWKQHPRWKQHSSVETPMMDLDHHHQHAAPIIPRDAAQKALKEWHRANCVAEVDDALMINRHYYGAKAINTTTSIQQGRMKRIVTEVSGLLSALPEGVYVRYASSRPDIMKILITGPLDTPYEFGLFEFDLWCPNDYPKSPPRMQFLTTGGGSVRFNPNLYENGKADTIVCLSILNTWMGHPWEPKTSTILQILVSIQGMILCEKPWYNEPGREQMPNEVQSDIYNISIQQNCLRVAIMPWICPEETMMEAPTISQQPGFPVELEMDGFWTPFNPNTTEATPTAGFHQALYAYTLKTQALNMADSPAAKMPVKANASHAIWSAAVPIQTGPASAAPAKPQSLQPTLSSKQKVPTTSAKPPEQPAPKKFENLSNLAPSRDMWSDVVDKHFGVWGQELVTILKGKLIKAFHREIDAVDQWIQLKKGVALADEKKENSGADTIQMEADGDVVMSDF